MKTKLGVAIFLLLFLTILFPFGIVFCQDQLEENTTFKIEVHMDGSATWIIERRFPLKTEEDVRIFQQYASEFEAQKEAYLEEFSNKTRELVNRASVITGRSMRAENFGIAVSILETATGSFGVIKYQYDWVGFAKVEDNRVTIGDVFEGGFYLYRDDALIVKYPSGYVIVAVSPTPDDTREPDRTLTWYGRRNFGAGEPTVILEKRVPTIIDTLKEYAPLIVGLIVIAGIGSAGLWFFKFRKKEKIGGFPPRVTLGIEDDEDRVIKLLRAAGGRLYQSTITEQCGFSKSKTSELLTAMEKRGIVKRGKKGREKLVTLIKG